jgi:nucleoside-diphosphate-sugar epimerase
MNVLLDKLADAMFPFGIPPRNRLPLPKDDPTHRLPDIKRAKTMLGWEPEVSLVDGLKKTIEYFREDLEKPHPIWRPGL